MSVRLFLCAACIPAAVAAQDPLSAITWLNEAQPSAPLDLTILEPPVTKSAAGPEISVQPLTALAQPLGLIPPDVTGLPTDLWQSSQADAVQEALASTPADRIPAMQTLLYTLLLAQALAPQGEAGDETLLLARIDRLIDSGALDSAQAMLEVAGPANTPARFLRWFNITLLTGDENRACAALNAAPHLSEDYAARIFCTLRKGDWSAAAVLLDGARALQLLPRAELFLLDRFLNPDIFEGAPPLPVPADPDPLTFRLYESIGEPLQTSPLPRAFAVADLRDLAGWKSQLEAAETLGRTGALTPNQLLGIYTARAPAASGGIWDRVEAVQRFEVALGTRSADAVAKTLPAAWAAMQGARLEVPFAALFGERLGAQPGLDDVTAGLVFRIRMLSPDYETAADANSGATDGAFLTGLARGAPGRGRSQEEQAIADAFAEPPPVPAALQSALDQRQLGEAILRAIALFDSGAQGNLGNLTDALATFRAVGLEDTARRAALQHLLLERN